MVVTCGSGQPLHETANRSPSEERSGRFPASWTSCSVTKISRQDLDLLNIPYIMKNLWCLQTTGVCVCKNFFVLRWVNNGSTHLIDCRVNYFQKLLRYTKFTNDYNRSVSIFIMIDWYWKYVWFCFYNCYLLYAFLDGNDHVILSFNLYRKHRGATGAGSKSLHYV